jgi:hypothetical protein
VPAEERTTVREELLRLQRVARVTRDASLADVLLSKGYESAQQVAFAEPSAFVADLARAGIPQEAAARVRRRALAHHRATLETFLRHNPDASGPSIPALRPGGATLADPAQLSIPTYAYLFGSQDYGVVEDWESVTSTGAYLVDLLVWLSRAPRTAGALHPYDVLVARRPDLATVLLDRDNAKVLVPHVDLVCELLEDEVAARAGRRRIPKTELQTRLTEKEIRAYPEHVNGDVYELLRTSTLAMSLPFDLPLLELRAYLEVPDLPGGTLNHPALVRLLGAALSEELPGKPSPGRCAAPRQSSASTRRTSPCSPPPGPTPPPRPRSGGRPPCPAWPSSCGGRPRLRVRVITSRTTRRPRCSGRASSTRTAASESASRTASTSTGARPRSASSTRPSRPPFSIASTACSAWPAMCPGASPTSTSCCRPAAARSTRRASCGSQRSAGCRST